MNKIYKGFYKQKLFTLKNALKIIKNEQVCKNTLTRTITNGLIKRIKKSVYYIVPLDDTDFYPDPTHIGSMIREDSTISHNTALKLLGYNINDPVIYLSSTNNKKLVIKNIIYKIYKKNDFGIEKVEYKTSYGTFEIKITDIERTIIECLWDRTIKIEQLAEIIKNKELDMKKIIKYLEKFNKPILYNKIGILIDMAEINISTEKIRDKLSNKIYYIKEKGFRLTKPKYKYQNKWNCMITIELWEKLKTKQLTQTSNNNNNN